MKQNLKYKAILIVALTLACLYGIIGLPTSIEQVKENFSKNIHLGLDLKGGSHLVMQIQVQDAFKTKADETIQLLRKDLSDKGITFTDIVRTDPNTIEDGPKIAIIISGVPPTQAGDLRQIVQDNHGALWNLASAGEEYRMTIKTTEGLTLVRDTLTQTMATIEKKINSLGLAESTVQQRGGTNAATEILVQLPGVDDPAHIKQVLKQAAKLELFEVQAGPFPSREEALASKNGVLGFGSQIKSTGRGSGEYLILARSAVVTGRDVRGSQAQRNATSGVWETTFVLSQDAARRFGDFTGSHVGKQLAIVLDDQVLMYPTINSKISDNGVIEGVGDQQTASDLALNLRAGSLPAGLVYLNEFSVGASLGAESIRSGMLAGLAGLIAVVAVMLIYYRGAGVNATVALILNAIILIAALAYFGAVLTLPGIAGIILTIGMAVDSNVLIFERIREELREGKAVVAAVDNGFSKAFLTIIDTHLTTVVSCGFLFLFGTSQVQGFAVTLVIGLLANLFTAIFVSRVMFDWSLAGPQRPETLSI
jgi:preprotein translocase subunit SecD